MTYRFAGGGDIVMTGYATLVADQRVIHGGGHSGRFKTKRGMANLAGFSNGDVIGSNAYRKHAVMAFVALLWQFVKHTTHVARFAINEAMGAREWKSGA